VCDGWCNTADCNNDGGDCSFPPAPPASSWPSSICVDGPHADTYLLFRSSPPIVIDNLADAITLCNASSDCNGVTTLYPGQYIGRHGNTLLTSHTRAISWRVGCSSNQRRLAVENSEANQAQADVVMSVTVGAERRLQSSSCAGGSCTYCTQQNYGDRYSVPMSDLTFGSLNILDGPVATCLVGFVCSVIAVILLLVGLICAWRYPNYVVIARLTGVALVFNCCYYIYLATVEIDYMNQRLVFKHYFSWGVGVNIACTICIAVTLVYATKATKEIQANQPAVDIHSALMQDKKQATYGSGTGDHA